MTIGFLSLAAAIASFSWTQWKADDIETAVNFEPSTYKNHNELLADVAEQVPEFGGAYVSHGGTTLNIYLTGDENDPAKRQKLQRALEESLDVESGLRLNVIIGEYTITQLDEWYDLMRTAGIWDQSGVVATDLHEGKNRLHVAVTSHHEIAGVETFLDRVSIPRNAVIIAVEEPQTPASHALQPPGCQNCRQKDLPE